MDSPAPVLPVMPLPVRPSLAYTVAFDAPGSAGCRQMARMLGGSMTRTAFGGEFLIVRNSPEPLFLVQREGVREFFVESADRMPEMASAMGTAKAAAEAVAAEAMEWKARVAEEVLGDTVGNYSWVLFLDVDCLALRNLDHLLAPDDPEVGILYQTESGRRIQESVFNGYLHELC